MCTRGVAGDGGCLRACVAGDLYVYLPVIMEWLGCCFSQNKQKTKTTNANGDATKITAINLL